MLYEKNSAFLKADFFAEIRETGYHLWKRGWAERNAGNISFLIEEETAKKYFELKKQRKTITLKTPVPELEGKIFLVTGTGSFFKNSLKKPCSNYGVIRIRDNGNSFQILWGFENNGAPTSELDAHLSGHVARLQQDAAHRIILHTHSPNLIAMTALHALDDAAFSRTLWALHSECLVVFPEGVGVLPWMVPGTPEIGGKTALKLAQYRIVVWPHHGIFGAGRSLDEALGLIETVEKAAEIFIKVRSCGGNGQSITVPQLKALADFFKVVPSPRIME